MLRPRVIPVLLLKDESLVKTVRFKDITYIGDPMNAVRIYNEFEVDELIFLDIEASKLGREPNYKLIGQLAEECFMPFAYGGGVTSLEQIKKILASGVEKIVLNSTLTTNPEVLTQAAELFGSQSFVASMDVNLNWMNRRSVLSHAASKKTSANPVDWAKRLESLGAGEIFVNSIDRDGTWQGYDIDLVRSITEAVQIPVIACGGAGALPHLREVIYQGGASGAAAGSIFVFQKQGLGVLINYPTPAQMDMLFGRNV